MVGGVMSWLIVPPIAAYLTVPGFVDIIASSSSTILGVTFLMGLLWGVGGLSYGLGVRYLGMSLGNSVVLGFCAAFGAIVPSIYYNFNPQVGKTTFTDMLSSSGGQVVLIGVLVCLLGITICGKAGMLKEKELSDEEKKKSVSEFNLIKGLVVAILSGILSSFFSFGIEAGKPLADALLSIKNKSYKDFTNKSTPISKNLLFSALAGTIWFLQFFFYGMGESKLGNGASSWILHMSTIILTANLWGIYRREWHGVAKKTKTTITVGIVIIILSVVLVGIGNSI